MGEMKPCKVRLTLLRRLAYLETYLASEQSLPSNKRSCIEDEVKALRHVLQALGMLNTLQLEDLLVKEQTRVLERGRNNGHLREQGGVP